MGVAAKRSGGGRGGHGGDHASEVDRAGGRHRVGLRVEGVEGWVNDVELRHHVVVLVDQVVAVHHVPAVRSGPALTGGGAVEAHGHTHGLVLADVDDVLRALLEG